MRDKFIISDRANGQKFGMMYDQKAEVLSVGGFRTSLERMAYFMETILQLRITSIRHPAMTKIVIQSDVIPNTYQNRVRKTLEAMGKAEYQCSQTRKLGRIMA